MSGHVPLLGEERAAPATGSKRCVSRVSGSSQNPARRASGCTRALDRGYRTGRHGPTISKMGEDAASRRWAGIIMEYGVTRTAGGTAAQDRQGAGSRAQGRQQGISTWTQSPAAIAMTALAGLLRAARLRKSRVRCRRRAPSMASVLVQPSSMQM